MKKKNSRKHRAARSLMILLGLLLSLQFFNVYNFAPVAALRDKERELGIDKTEEIARAQYTKALEIVLSGREDLLLVTEGGMGIRFRLDTGGSLRSLSR